MKEVSWILHGAARFCIFRWNKEILKHKNFFMVKVHLVKFPSVIGTTNLLNDNKLFVNSSHI